MASLCRSAAMVGSRSVGAQAKNLVSKFLAPKSTAMPAPSLHSTRTASRAMRIAAVLGSAVSLETMMPLHSAIASARLKSIIAMDSSCWSWLSQGISLPL